MALVLTITASDPVPVIIEDDRDFPFGERVAVVDGEITVVSERDDWREASDDEFQRYYEHYMKEA